MKITVNKINESEVFKMACLRKKRMGLPEHRAAPEA